jgi:hypothetical protein
VRLRPFRSFLPALIPWYLILSGCTGKSPIGLTRGQNLILLVNQCEDTYLTSIKFTSIEGGDERVIYSLNGPENRSDRFDLSVLPPDWTAEGSYETIDKTARVRLETEGKAHHEFGFRPESIVAGSIATIDSEDVEEKDWRCG